MDVTSGNDNWRPYRACGDPISLVQGFSASADTPGYSLPRLRRGTLGACLGHGTFRILTPADEMLVMTRVSTRGNYAAGAKSCKVEFYLICYRADGRSVVRSTDLR